MDENTTVERTVVTNNPTGVTETVTTRNHYFWEDFFVSKTNQVIFTLLGIVNLLIALRLVFLLLGANRTGFILFLIDLTNIFVAPFRGIFPSPVVEGSYFEAASVVAIIVWTIFAYILSVIIGLFSRDTTV